MCKHIYIYVCVSMYINICTYIYICIYAYVCVIADDKVVRVQDKTSRFVV